jgi:iron complex outermembrane receptor protein
VDIRGVDFEAGLRPLEHLSLYASATFQKSEIKKNIFVTVTINGVSGIPAFLPTAGKEFTMTPDREFSGRAQYDIGDLTLGFQGKYISSRFSSDTNDDRIPGYAKFDLDAEYKFPEHNGIKTSIRVNVDNLFDRFYISKVSTVNTANPITINTVDGRTATFNPSTPFLTLGSPRTFYVSLRAEF